MTLVSAVADAVCLRYCKFQKVVHMNEAKFLEHCGTVIMLVFCLTFLSEVP
jgi:hypothetical protein